MENKCCPFCQSKVSNICENKILLKEIEQVPVKPVEYGYQQKPVQNQKYSKYNPFAPENLIKPSQTKPIQSVPDYESEAPSSIAMGFDTYCRNKEKKQPDKYDFEYKPQPTKNYDHKDSFKPNFYPSPMEDTLDFKDCLGEIDQILDVCHKDQRSEKEAEKHIMRYKAISNKVKTVQK